MPRRALPFAALALGVVAALLVWRHEHPPAPPPQPVANRAFRPAARPTDPAVLWAVGDGADGGQDATALAERIAADHPARLLYLGDVYGRGSAGDFAKHYAPVYGGLARVTAPTPGNHDWPAHREGYDPYWRGVTGAPTPPWYAFRIGGWRVLSLNSEAPMGAATAQGRWLRAEVRRGTGRCTLAFWHRPRWSAGRHGDQGDVAALWDPLRGHATLVLNGHDHDLQRFEPRDGITELVSGAGGKSHYGVDAGDPRLAFSDDERDGALRLALRPGRADLAFVAADGAVLDRSSVSCA